MLVDQIKEIRKATGAGLGLCKKALEQHGSVEKAIEAIKLKLADYPKIKPTPAGVVYTYTHQDRIGVIVEMKCETELAKNTPEFRTLVKDTALHIAATEATPSEDILEKPFIKNESVTMSEQILYVSNILREAVGLTRFYRVELG